MEHILLWGTVLVLALVAEILTAALVSVWFIPSAAVCILLELAGVKSLGIQAAVFVLLSAVLAFFLREKIAESFKKSATKTNVDALIGKTATVEEDIPSGGVGRVYVSGMSWAAYTEEPRVVLRGESVKVESVSGVRLLCKPLENEGKKPDESLIGKRARVEKPVDNFSADGTVICEGSTYLAESEDDTVLPTDTVVSIIGCRDGKVLCRPYNKTATNNSYNSEEEASWRS